MSANSQSSRVVDGKKSSLTKRFGCLFLSILLFIFWLLGAYYLWNASQRQPQGDKDEDSHAIFEIIPGSDERSSPDDEMEDKGKIPDN